MTVEITLPWPPSVNHYWRRVGAKTLVSAGGRRYRTLVWQLCQAARLNHLRLEGSIGVTIAAHPPDRRVRDLDNLLKPLLDAIQSAGVIENDGLIDQLSITRGECRPQGEVRVEILAL